MRNDPGPTLSPSTVGDAAKERPRHRAERLTGPLRRTQVLKIAAALFARNGLHGTTTQCLAEAAGVSEPVLYLHFSSKESLFRQTVENNIETRLRTLGEQLASIGNPCLIDAIERMAEATVLVCVCGNAHAVLTNWALLEAPDYAVDLYRDEIRAAGLTWRRVLSERLPASRSHDKLSTEFVPRAVELCLAHGMWLAAQRYTAENAAAPARRFASCVAQSALAYVTDLVR